MHIRGKELWVEQQGEGQPVLFVHGLGGTANVWEPQVRGIPGAYKFIRVDLNGSGRSKPSGPISMDGWIDDLIAVLDAGNIEKARMVGHSMGTLVLQHLAVKHPDRVESLALLGVSQWPFNEARRQASRDRAAKVRSAGMSAIADAVLKNALSPHTIQNKLEVVAFVRELLMRQDPEGYAGACEASAASADLDMSKIACPVLLITGKDDAVSNLANSETVAQKMGDAKIQLLEQCGHWMTIEQPVAVNKALAGFLA
jgi:pimeloyl-ACP methyl ester carboxylesterase